MEGTQKDTKNRSKIRFLQCKQTCSMLDQLKKKAPLCSYKSGHFFSYIFRNHHRFGFILDRLTLRRYYECPCLINSHILHLVLLFLIQSLGDKPHLSC